MQRSSAFASGVDPFSYAINTNRAIACYQENGDLFYYDNDGRGYDYNILNELKYSGNENRSRNLNISVDVRWTMMEGLVFATTLGGIQPQLLERRGLRNERIMWLDYAGIIMANMMYMMRNLNCRDCLMEEC